MSVFQRLGQRNKNKASQGNDETKPKTTHTSDVDSVLENKKKRVSEVAPTSSNLPPRPALKRSATTLTGGGYSLRSSKLARHDELPVAESAVEERLNVLPPKDVTHLLYPEHYGWRRHLYEAQHSIQYMIMRQRTLCGEQKSTSLNDQMRATLVDWLAQVCLHTRLLPETFHRAVQLTDTFSHTSVVVRGDYQLVGTCALWIAAKVDERYVPSLRSLVDLTDGAYARKDMKLMERRMLVSLDFDTGRPEPAWFARMLADWAAPGVTLMYKGIAFPVETALLYLVTLAAHQPCIYRRYVPSQIAVAALYVTAACEPLRVRVPPGLCTVMGESMHSQKALDPLTAVMADMFLKARTISPGIYGWYTRTRFHRWSVSNDWATRFASGLRSMASCLPAPLVCGAEESGADVDELSGAPSSSDEAGADTLGNVTTCSSASMPSTSQSNNNSDVNLCVKLK